MDNYIHTEILFLRHIKIALEVHLNYLIVNIFRREKILFFHENS